MKLSQKEVGGAVVVYIRDKFVGGQENSDKFHAVFKSLLKEDRKRVVVNLSKTPWANSQGIGMLISAHTSLSNAGGELVLCNVTDRIHDILSVTRLLLIFKTFETEEEALKYLATKG